MTTQTPAASGSAPDPAAAGVCPVAHAYPFRSRPVELELSPEYAALRAEEPLARVHMPYGPDGWLVTRHEDVKTVMSDPRFSRAAVVGADVPRVLPERTARPDGIINMDAPEHGRLRRLVASAFTARRAEALRPRVREIADELIAGMVAAGAPGDLVESVDMPLPVIVICELLGVPLEGRPIFRAGADAFLSNSSVPAEEREAAFQTLMSYMTDLVAERRARTEAGDAPGDDVLGTMIAVRDEDGDRLSENELVQMGVGILVAGHETTMNMLGNMVWTLLSERSRWQSLVADPDRIPAAVEEMLRMTPLGNQAGLPRIATEDVELCGGTVHAGDTVLPSTAAANRDPAVFDDPEALHLDRTDGGHGGHVAFGFGPHHCLGASLARMELQTALTALVTALPSLEPAGPDAITWRTTSAVRGAKQFHVRW